MINEKNDKTSLNFWFPKLAGLPIPQPRTIIVPCEPDIDFEIRLLDAAERIGFPLFMRTDLSAGKHDWKNTCYVKDKTSLHRNLTYLFEYNQMADIMGLPYTSVVIREFLDLETSFKAFPGDMPINKERRYFIESGEVLCHHPYWPIGAFEDEYSLHVSESQKGWRTKLNQLNFEEPEEIKLLSYYARLVSKRLEGFWSVDFAKSKSGSWYLIDMAVGEASYHWKGCPNEARQINA